MSVCKDDRIVAANAMLACFAPDTTLRLESGYVVVEWTDRRGKQSRRWLTRGQDWYPVWFRHWPHGGTATVALSQLVRFVQGKPVMGFATWRYWAGEGVALIRHGDLEAALATLKAAGYPEEPKCVLCGQTGSIGDWWSLSGVSGPCCGMRRGCHQKGGDQ